MYFDFADTLNQEEYQKCKTNNKETIFRSSMVLNILIYRNNKIHIKRILTDFRQKAKRLLSKRSVDMKHFPIGCKTIICNFMARQETSVKFWSIPVRFHRSFGCFPDRYNTDFRASSIVYRQVESAVFKIIRKINIGCF